MRKNETTSLLQSFISLLGHSLVTSGFDQDRQVL